MNTHVEGIVLTPAMVEILKNFQDTAFRRADLHVGAINEAILFILKNRELIDDEDGNILSIICGLHFVMEDLKEFDFVEAEN